MEKQVIFVNGTERSGTTFLHMILANDPQGFACGEVHGLLRPIKPNHVQRRCGCGDPNCRLWETVRQRGEEQLYATIFEVHPEVKFIVDSSKQPFWINAQIGYLQQQGIAYRDILIWKTPFEFAHSKKKRGEFDEWERAWVNTHRIFFSLIAPIQTVKYNEFVADPAVLARLCGVIGIPYFAGKERYWEKQHHVLGGSNTAKYHLYEQAQAKEILTDTAGTRSVKQHRSIEYSQVSDPELYAAVKARLDQSAYLTKLIDLLTAHDIAAGQPDRALLAQIRFSTPEIVLRRLKNQLTILQGRWRYRQPLPAVSAQQYRPSAG